MSRIKKSDISWIDTTEYLIIHYQGRPCQVKKTDSEKYRKVQSLVKRGRNKDLVDFLFPNKKGVVRYTAGQFRVDEDGMVWAKGIKEPVHESISKYLVDFYRKKLPVEPLIKFWGNLSKNPSQDSKEQLYLFLRHNRMPLTPDGCFLAYKKVDNRKGRLVDNYTKSICNDIGVIVKMPRKDVDPNRRQTCSNGLHVASWNYAQNYSGSTLLEVKVNPEHVVAVPDDYNNEKMRVCQYQPWSLSRARIESDYLAPDALRLMKKRSEKVMKIEREEIGKGQTILLEGKTAQEILEFVEEKTGIEIKINPKNKKSIIKQATELLAEHKIAKNISFKGKTAREIVEIVEKQLGKKIEGSLKNKDSIVNKAAKILKQYGFKVRKK